MGLRTAGGLTFPLLDIDTEALLGLEPEDLEGKAGFRTATGLTFPLLGLAEPEDEAGLGTTVLGSFGILN